MRALLRILIVIPFAYVTACIAAAFVIFLAAGAGAGVDPAESAGDLTAKLLVLSVIAAMFVGAIAGIPALVMIVLAEALGWRSFVLHLVVGAAIGFAAFLVVGNEPPASADSLKLGAAAGAVAGFVYWLIAGRTAGLRERQRERGAVPTPTP